MLLRAGGQMLSIHFPVQCPGLFWKSLVVKRLENPSWSLSHRVRARTAVQGFCSASREHRQLCLIVYCCTRLNAVCVCVCVYKLTYIYKYLANNPHVSS